MATYLSSGLTIFGVFILICLQSEIKICLVSQVKRK